MLEVIIDTLIDSLKLLPFLFVVYLIMEFLEHKSSQKTEKLIKSSGKFGPIVGSVLGAFPQCGFSVMASNLYVVRIISLGTLIAIYLSTSDEMLPILLTSGMSGIKIIKFILVKIVIGMLAGLIIDLFISKKNKKPKTEISKICDHEHCHCDENIWLSSLKHTLSIFSFILIINFIMNAAIFMLGEDKLSSLLIQNNFIGPVVSSLIGLIPNCASSVIITELFVNGALTFGSTLAGLLSASGIGILVLFKLNKNYKENFKILFLVYIISVVVGVMFNLLNFVI